MTHAKQMDRRKKIMAALNRGDNPASIARRFDVSQSTVKLVETLMKAAAQAVRSK